MTTEKTPLPSISIAPAPTAAPRPVAPPARRSDLLSPTRRLGLRLQNEWLPQAVWYVGRTGRVGLVGIALLIASAFFVFSTHLKVADEAAALRAELATAQVRARSAPRSASNEAAQALRNLPGREAMPALLGVLLKQADDAHLAVDTAKYESSATRSGDITRYKVSFPVTGPYPQVRQFIDAVLVALPAVSISELSVERKTIGDASVEARIRLTFYTRGTP